MTTTINLQNLLEEKKLDALFLSSYDTILYLTQYAGFVRDENDAYLLITKKNSYLLTNTLYSQQTKKVVPHFTTLEWNSKVGVDQHLMQLIEKDKITTVGFEPLHMSVSAHKHFKKVFPRLKSINLRPLREIKTAEEIILIHKACELSDRAYEYVLKNIGIGMTEKQLAWEFEKYVREHDAELSFPTIVAFGKNAAIPHHLTSNQPLTPNTCILLDFGVRKNNYCSDTSRTIFFGTPTNEQIKMYEVVKTAQKKTVQFLTSYLLHPKSNKKSLKASKIDLVARDYIVNQNYPAFPHALGHGIGIAVHEAPILSPRSDDYLQNGTVFTLEPGIYLDGKMGVRIEDMFAIKQNQLIQLTQTTNQFTIT